MQVGKKTNGTHDKPEDEQQRKCEKLGDKMKQMKSKDMEMKILGQRQGMWNHQPDMEAEAWVELNEQEEWCNQAPIY